MTRAATAHESEVPIILPRHAIIALMRAADGARRAMTRTLQAFDLTLPQFNVLTILRFNDGLPTFQVAARMVEATPGITRLMMTLEAKGYISRSQSAGDRRQQLCSLTAAGVKVVDAGGCASEGCPRATSPRSQQARGPAIDGALEARACAWRAGPEQDAQSLKGVSHSGEWSALCQSSSAVSACADP